MKILKGIKLGKKISEVTVRKNKTLDHGTSHQKSFLP